MSNEKHDMSILDPEVRLQLGFDFNYVSHELEFF